MGGLGAVGDRKANSLIGNGTGATKKQGNKKVTVSECGKEVTMPRNYFNNKMQEITTHKVELEKNKANVANLKEEVKQADPASIDHLRSSTSAQWPLPTPVLPART